MIRLYRWVTKEYGASGSVFLFFLLMFLPTSASAELSLESLRDRAAQEKLAQQRSWQVLLHYRSEGTTVESLVDDRRFFFATNGKHDPAAELDATLSALLAAVETPDTHLRCRFPARAEWLIEQLQIPESALPQPICGELNETLTQIDPQSAVLVFPAAHNNGPASMFGHTLLRIGSSYQSELLSHAINYAAQVNDSNGLLYAFKGLFGLYNGYFSVLPYYEKLNEYSALEHRDVWEYELNLTPEEVRRLVLHTWEMKQIASDYYFFDENCSFMLLFLIEAARPELQLAEEYWQRAAFWVIPVDTITTLRQAGLVRDIRYRPAQATRIQHRLSLLPEEASAQAFAIAMGETPAKAVADDATLPLEERRQILDLATDYLQYRYSRKAIPADAFRPAFLKLLTPRSALGKEPPLVVPTPAVPESGHASGRWRTGVGEADGELIVDLDWRPAYHDLLDPDTGFTKGAQIDFFALSGRAFPERGGVQLQSFRPVDIFSLAARNRFFTPVSWRVNFGLDREPRPDGQETLLTRLNTGGGLAWEIGEAALLYTMAEADINLSSHLEQGGAIGGGLHSGLLLTPSPREKLHLQGSATAYLIDRERRYRADFDYLVKTLEGQALSLFGHWQWLEDGRELRHEGGIRWVWYR